MPTSRKRTTARRRTDYNRPRELWELLDTNSTNKRTRQQSLYLEILLIVRTCPSQKKRKRGNERKKILANRKAHFYSRPPSQKNSLKHITSKRASDTWKWDRVKEMSDPWVFDNEADYPQRWTRGVRFLLRLPKTIFFLSLSNFWFFQFGILRARALGNILISVLPSSDRI